jgi:hypothetical protein
MLARNAEGGMKRVAVAVAMALAAALAACGRETAEETMKQFPPTEAPNYNADIGPNGAAGVTRALPLTVEALTAAAPGYVVAEAQGQIEGQPFRMITLSAGDEVVFEVLPSPDGTRIHALVTRSTQARGPNGEIVGQATFETAPAAQSLFCTPELVDGALGFACSDAEDGVFWRVYRLPQSYNGPHEPFEAIDPDAALDATLAEMRWLARG